MKRNTKAHRLARKVVPPLRSRATRHPTRPRRRVRSSKRSPGPVSKRRPVRLSRKPKSRARISAEAPAGRPAPGRKSERPAPSVHADTGRIQEVLDRLAAAQSELSARGVDLLAVAHELGRTAVESFKADLLRSLVEDRLLPDLKRLIGLMAAAPCSADDPRSVPEATLNWFERHLDLTEHLQPGQCLEVPVARLSEYQVRDSLPSSGLSLVKIKVQAPGWKCRGRTVVPPTVEIVQAQDNAAPEPGPSPSPSPSS